MTEKTRRQWVVIGVAGVLGAILLLLCASFLVIQTDFARKEVTAKLSSLLSREPEQKVVLENLEGVVPFRMRLGRVVVSDAEGVWLTGENIVLNWSPLALLTEKLRIEELGASRIQIDRLPPSAPEKPKESRPFTLPQKLPPVVVEHLNVEQLALGEPVLGRSGVFRLKGDVLEAGDGGGLTASLHAGRTDEGPETRLDLVATLKGNPPELVVEGELHEAPNGWLAGVLNLKEAGELQLALRGKGPLSAWKGTLSGSVGKYGSINMNVHLGMLKDITLDLDGKGEVVPSFLPPSLAPLLGAENRFGITLHFVSGESVALNRVDLQSASYRLQGTGKLDLKSQAVQSDFSLGVEDLKVLAPLAGIPLAGAAGIQMRVAGTLQQPQGNILLDFKKLQTDQVRIEQVLTDLKFESLDSKASSLTGLRISGSGSAKQILVPREKKLPETSLSWSLDLGVPFKGSIAVHRFEIEGDQHSLKVAGDFDPAKLSGDLDTKLEIKDLRMLTALLGEEHPGALALKVQVKGEERTGSATARIDGELTRVEGLPPALTALLGPKVTVTGNVALKERKDLQVSAFRLEGQGVRLTSEAAVNLSGKTLKGNWKLSLPELKPVGTALKKSMAGSVEAEGDVKGSFDALELAVSLRGKNIAWEKSKFEQIVSDLHARGVPRSPTGDFLLEVKQGKGVLKASTGFSLENKNLKLASLRMEAPGGKVEGDLKAVLDKTLLEGTLDGRFKNLGELGRFLGQSMGGSVEFNVRLSHAREEQDVKATLKGKGIASSFGNTEQLSLEADLKNVLRAPRGSADAQIKGFQSGGLALRSFDLQAAGDGKGVRLEAKARGHAVQDFDFKTEGQWGRVNTTDRVQLKTFSGNFGKYPVNLQQPFLLDRSPQGLSFEKLALKFGKGSLQASGGLGPKKVDLDAELDRFPLEMLALFGVPDLSGTGAGRLQLAGDPGRPVTRMNLRLTDIRSGKSSLQNVPPASLTVEGSLEGGRLKAEAQLEGPVKKPAKASLAVPARFSLDPFAFEVSPSSPLQGSLDAEADLARLMQFVPQEGQKLAGNLTAHLDIGGTVSEPGVSGDAVIEKGHYENQATGTVLSNLSAKVVARGKRLDIENLTATDSGAGKISATGGLELDPEKDFPFKVEITFTDATLVRREDVTGTVRGGLDLAGSSRNVALGGNLEVAPAQINLPKSLPPELTRLDVIEIHGPVEMKHEGKPEIAPPPFKLGLNLRVVLPGRIFVRGRGLDSEWGGNLRIEGSADAPVIIGNLNVIRGYFDFLDKRFKLVKGTIQFDGTSPPSPYLEVTAEAQAKDITARLLISGLVSSPKIELESDPYLPKDEILARILFGRSLSNVTPVQALKLAKAAETLSTGGNTLDFMGRSRKILGLDQLDIREAEGESAAAVGIGKYLTEDIYVDVQKDVSGQAGKARVEVEITPNITITGEAGSDATTGLGVNWKYDY
ncbi:MAG: hypothetical protein GX433_01415 [Deltaproteobacteria bacterium]|nr:hypothetical protein [Deltaproteobacteria bacterium]